MPPIVVDTGPLVAYFHQLDHDHPRAKAWFEGEARRHRLLSTEAVVTEASHLLDFDVPLQTDFIDWVDASIEVVPLVAGAYAELTPWMRTYANIPMDFADATLLWLYRATPDAAILTLDQRDFGSLRLPDDKRRRLKLVPLPAPGEARPRHAR